MSRHVEGLAPKAATALAMPVCHQVTLITNVVAGPGANMDATAPVSVGISMDLHARDAAGRAKAGLKQPAFTDLDSECSSLLAIGHYT